MQSWSRRDSWNTSRRARVHCLVSSRKHFAKEFTKYRRKHGVDRPQVVFHSLRKSFISCLEEAEVPADTAALLAGHKSRRSFTFSVYNPAGPTLKKLAEALAKVHYKSVKLPRKQ